MTERPTYDSADLDPDPAEEPDLAEEPDPGLALDETVTLGEAENSPEDAVQAQAEELPQER